VRGQAGQKMVRILPDRLATMSGASTGMLRDLDAVFLAVDKPCFFFASKPWARLTVGPSFAMAAMRSFPERPGRPGRLVGGKAKIAAGDEIDGRFLGMGEEVKTGLENRKLAGLAESSLSS